MRDRVQGNDGSVAILRWVLAGALFTLGVFFSVAGLQTVAFDDPLYVGPHSPATFGISSDSVAWAFSLAENYWHPLSRLIHAAEFSAFGNDLALHHLVNLLFHVFTGLVLFWLLNSCSNQPYPSAAAALLFGLHPLRVESVAWLAELKDVASGFFYVATLLAYVRYTRAPDGRRYSLVLAAYALAVMAKPSVVSLPLALLLLDFWPLSRKAPISRLIIEKIPFFFMAAGLAIVTETAQRRNGALGLLGEIPLPVRLGHAVVSYVLYLGKIVWPASLACHYTYRSYSAPVVALCAAVLLGISALCIWQGKQRPYLLFGWAWFIVTLLPNIGIVQAGRQGMADRFTYIPMMGLSAALVWLAWEFYERHALTRRPLQLGTAAVLAAMIVLTNLQTPVWHDSISLFTQAVKINPDDEFVQGNLASALIAVQRNQEAVPHLEKAIASAPSNGAHWQNLALVDYTLDRTPDAEKAVSRAIELRPDHFEPLTLAARIEFRAGHIDRTRDLLGSAVAHGAPNEMAGTLANDFGTSLARKGRIAEAEGFFRLAVESEPCRAQSSKNLQAALEDLGRGAEGAEVRRAFEKRCLAPTLRP